MPSYTEEQRRRAIETVEECGGSVTRAMRRLGYPSRQTLHQWLNHDDASHGRRAGRPWSHYDPVLKEQAVAFVRSGMSGKDVASMLGVSSAAVVHNWARAAGSPRPTADRSPMKPVRDSETRAHDGFEGDLEERVRRLELENDIPRGVARVLKAGSPDSLTNRGNALAIDELRATADRSLREPTDFLRISKSSHEHQRAALARPDEYAALRARVRDVFEATNGSRGHRCVTHELRSGGRPREGVGEGRPGPDARGGPRRRLREEEGQVRLVQGRDVRGPREPGRAEVRRRRAQQALADRHNRVRPARRQGPPVADNGLLRRRAPGVVHRHEPRRQARQRQPRGRVPHPPRGRGADDSLGPGVPPPAARLDRDLREEPPGRVDFEEGLLARQLGDGGVLREAQERLLPPPGLIGGDGAGVLPHARRLPEVLQRAEAEGEAGLAEPDAVP